MFSFLAHFKRPLTNSRGMSLLEIMIVLGIIGTITAVLVNTVMDRMEKSKVSETKIRMNTVVQALSMYYTDCGKYPDTLEVLSTGDASCTNYIADKAMARKDALLDAWKTPFAYSQDGSNFDVKSLGSDRKEGGAGTARDISTTDE